MSLLCNLILGLIFRNKMLISQSSSGGCWCLHGDCLYAQRHRHAHLHLLQVGADLCFLHRAELAAIWPEENPWLKGVTCTIIANQHKKVQPTCNLRMVETSRPKKNSKIWCVIPVSLWPCMLPPQKRECHWQTGGCGQHCPWGQGEGAVRGPGVGRGERLWGQGGR